MSAEEAYFALDLPSARRILEQLIERKATAPKDLAGALTRLAIQDWRFYGDYGKARKRLEQADRVGVERSAVWTAMSRIAREAGRYGDALASARSALTLARTKSEIAAARSAICQTALDEAAAIAANGGRPDATRLNEASRLSSAALLEEPGEPNASKVLLGISLLQRDGPSALSAWRQYFQLRSDQAVSGMLAEPYKNLHASLAAWKGSVLSREDRMRLVLALAGSRFFRYAALMARVEPIADAPAVEDALAYADFLNQVQRVTEDYYRAVALGRNTDGEYERTLDAAFTGLWQTLHFAGERPPYARERFVSELRNRFGTELRLGANGNFGGLDLILGHRVGLERKSVKQYGRRIELSLLSIDMMVANGYSGWFWDGRAATGGWGAYPEIAWIRGAYLGEPYQYWRRLTDAEERSEWERENAPLSAEDDRLAGANPYAYLPGVTSRIYSGQVKRLYDSQKTKGYSGTDVCMAFVSEFLRVKIESSIFAHEGRHAIDQALFSWRSHLWSMATKEFRAKLSEVAFAPDPKFALAGGSILGDRNIAGRSPHSAANLRMKKMLLNWMERFGDRTTVEALGARLGHERVRSGLIEERVGAIAQDLRYAWRTLGKERGFAFVAISILALGIATNTAVFSVVNTVMLRPLPFPHAEQLVWLESGRNSSAAGRKSNGLSTETYTVAAYEEIQKGLGSFQGIASYNPFFARSEYTLMGRGEPQSIAGVWVSENFFQTLGVGAAIGRLFTAEECRHGGPPATLLSNAFWRTRFGADPRIVGRTVRLRQGSGEASATVVGVLPENFDFGAVFAPGVRFDIFLPAVLDDMRNMGNALALVGRLKPGVSVAQAQTEASVAIPQIQAAHKDWARWGDYTSSISSLGDRVAGKLRRPLVALWSAAGLILLIACVNLSNLLLARGAAREREFALRSALGAGRVRLFRQLLTEGALLTAAGAACGVALAFALVGYIARQDAIALPLLSQAKLDGSALLWTILIASAVTLLFGLVPALTLRGRDLQTPLKTAAHGSTGSRRRESFRSALVVSEVALACVLAVGAGLLLRSFVKVMDVDLGFQPDHAAVIRVDYDDGGNLTRRGPVLQEMLRRISAIPGVNAAGIGDTLPLGRNRSWPLSAKGKSYDKTVQQNALVRVVTPGYLRAMGMRLAAGRDFEWTDGNGSENVTILNQAAVRRFWGEEDPFGRLAVAAGRDTRVVGVISDVRANSMETAAGPEMYLPAMQSWPTGAELVIRSAVPPEALAATVMKTLRELNPAQPAAELRPLRDIVDRSVSPRRFFVWLVAGFAGLGLTLASLGVYGVISYSVARRHREIGIRMALGASAARVRTAVIGRALALALAGMAAGGAASFAVARWMEPLLFGVKPSDVGTFAAIALLLGAAAYAGSYLPARRAARIDPAVALRAGE